MCSAVDSSHQSVFCFFFSSICLQEDRDAHHVRPAQRTGSARLQKTPVCGCFDAQPAGLFARVCARGCLSDACTSAAAVCTISARSQKQTTTTAGKKKRQGWGMLSSCDGAARANNTRSSEKTRSRERKGCGGVVGQCG